MLCPGIRRVAVHWCRWWQRQGRDTRSSVTCGRPRCVAKQRALLAAIDGEWPFKLASFKLQPPGSKPPHLTTFCMRCAAFIWA